jgi:hypothetical protein
MSSQLEKVAAALSRAEPKNGGGVRFKVGRRQRACGARGGGPQQLAALAELAGAAH